MDELLALDAEQDESAALCELLEIVDEWVGCSQGARGHRKAHPTPAPATDTHLLACSESAKAATGSTEPAPPIATAPWPRVNGERDGDPLKVVVNATPASGNKRPRARNSAVDVRRRLRKKAEHSFLRMEARDLELQLAALQQTRRGASRAIGESVLQHAFPSTTADTQGENVSDKQHQALQLDLRQAVAVNRRLSARVVKNDALLRSLRNAIRCGTVRSFDHSILVSLSLSLFLAQLLSSPTINAGSNAVV